MDHFLKTFEEVTRSQWDRPALTNFHGKSYTHAEMAQEIARLHRLYRELGIQPGDKVAIAAKNSAQWAIALLASFTYHAVVVPILADFTPQNIQALTGHADSSLLFTDQKIFAAMQPAEIAGLKAVLNLEDFSMLYAADDATAEAIKRAAEAPDEKLTPDMIHYASDNMDEMVIINYTSGTTGNPKGIMLNARSLSANIIYGQTNIPNRPGETAISMLPLAHMYGLTFEFLYTFLGGCHLYFLGKMPTPTVLMQAFAEIKPYILITVPLVLEKIVKSKVMPALSKAPLRQLKYIPIINSMIYKAIGKKIMQFFGGNIRTIPIGGAAMNPTIEKLLRRMRIPVTVGYGMTECGPLISYADWTIAKPGCCGRIVNHLDIRVDSTDPQNIAGELQVKGDGVMLGYYKNPEATAAAFTADGWLRTGDLGTIDKEGNISIRGRSKCMILSSSGQNIYPEEIEGRINAMDHINESLVLERDHRLVALISLNAEEGDPILQDVQGFAENLRQQLNLELPSYSQISKVEVLADGFVHTPKHSIKRYLYT